MTSLRRRLPDLVRRIKVHDVLSPGRRVPIEEPPLGVVRRTTPSAGNSRDVVPLWPLPSTRSQVTKMRLAVLVRIGLRFARASPFDHPTILTFSSGMPAVVGASLKLDTRGLEHRPPLFDLSLLKAASASGVCCSRGKSPARGLNRCLTFGSTFPPRRGYGPR